MKLSIELLPNPRTRIADALVKDAKEARSIALSNHERANNVVLVSEEVTAMSEQFEWKFKLPSELPWPRVIVRASTAKGSSMATGVLAMAVVK